MIFTEKFINLRIRRVMKLSNKSSVKEKKSSKTVLRVIKMLFSFYPVMMPVSLVCVIISAIVSSIPAVFMQNVISVIERSWQSEMCIRDRLGSSTDSV